MSKNKKWIFQTNPDRCRMKDALLDLDAGRESQLKIQTWRVSRYKKDIKIGDIALIWICKGKCKEKAGVYAEAEVVSNPTSMFEFKYEEEYWINEKDKGNKELRVIIKITKNLVNTPLMEEELIKEKKLHNLEILKVRVGTNFRVSDEEYVILSKLIKNK